MGDDGPERSWATIFAALGLILLVGVLSVLLLELSNCAGIRVDSASDLWE